MHTSELGEYEEGREDIEKYDKRHTGYTPHSFNTKAWHTYAYILIYYIYIVIYWHIHTPIHSLPKHRIYVQCNLPVRLVWRRVTIVLMFHLDNMEQKILLASDSV